MPNPVQPEAPHIRELLNVQRGQWANLFEPVANPVQEQPVGQANMDNNISSLFDDKFDPDVEVVKLEPDGDFNFQYSQFRKKYNLTICKVNGHIRRIENITTSPDKEGKKCIYVMIAGEYKTFESLKIEPLWLEGLYNYEGRVILFEKHPNRQWYRSSHPENTEWSEPLWPILFQAENSSRQKLFKRFNYDKANRLTTFTSFYQAYYKLVNREALACAFSPDYFLSLHYNAPSGLLVWRKNQVVGYMSEEDRKTIFCTDPDYKEEMTDAMKGLCDVK